MALKTWKFRNNLMLVCGEIGTGFLTMTLGMYALRFFAPTEDTGLPLLVPIGVFGVVQSISVFFDVVIDPWIASKSDRSKNPKGRRLPFMGRAFIPAGIFCIIIFMTPVQQNSWINAIWVAVCLFCYCLFRSMYDVPLRAMVPEIIYDPDKRAKYYTLVTICGLTSQMIMAVVPTLVPIFRGGGMPALEAWRISLSVFPVLGMVFMAIPVILLKENDFLEKHLDQEPLNFWGSIKEVLSFDQFRRYAIAMIFCSFASGVASAALLFYVDKLFGLASQMGTVFMVSSMVFMMICYPIIIKLSRTVGKRRQMLVSLAFFAVVYLGLFFYDPLANIFGYATAQPGSFWASIGGEGARIGYIIYLLVLSFFFAYPIACGNVVDKSIWADFAHYDRLRTGKSRAGMFMAMVNVIFVIPSTLAPGLVGLVIYIRSTNETPSTYGVRLTALIAAIACAVAAVLMVWYKEKDIRKAIDADVAATKAAQG
jgi:GPH family glycoside/pentoside/hexuronide:cation symporter